MLRGPVSTSRVLASAYPFPPSITTKFSTRSHQFIGSRSRSTKNLQRVPSKAATPAKSDAAKLLGSKFFDKKLLEQGERRSKPSKHLTHITSARTVPPTSPKVLIDKPPAKLGLYQKSKDGTTISSLNPAIHSVGPGVLYPGDTQQLRLPWGGTLSYARLGRAKEMGEVWINLHGTPGSRISSVRNHKYCERNSIRLVAVDRPGYGYSTLKRGRTMLDFMKDVEYLLNFLGVKQFKMTGCSGGGPYVLAAAHHFSKDRLIKSLILCGMTHPDYDQASIATWIKMRRMLTGYLPGYYRFIRLNTEPYLNRRVMEAKGNNTKIARIHAEHQETHRQGISGYQYDEKLVAEPWGFDLKDIHASPIRWYHGALDVNTSSSAARATVEHANRLRKNIEYKEYPGLDHYELQWEHGWAAWNWLKKKD